MEYVILFGIISLLIFIAPLISSVSRLPVVVVEILLGALAFNIGILQDSKVISEVAHIGFLFLMFLAGVEVDLRSFKKLGSAFIKRTLLFFVILYLLALLIVWLVGLSIIYVVAFPVMSLGMIMVLIQEYGKDREWLDLCLKIGIIGELISILMLVLLNGYYAFGHSLALYKSLLHVLIFLLFMALVFRLASIAFWWFPRLRLMLIPETNAMNEDMRYCAMLFFVMLVIVSLLRIEAVLGAFLSGLVVSQFFRHKKDLHQKLNDFGFGFFIPFFFVHIGITLDLKTILSNSDILLHAFYISMTMLLIRFIASAVAFRTFFNNIRHVALFSLSIAMPLTFLVATATFALNIGAIPKEQYYSFVLAAILETMLFMIVIMVLARAKLFLSGIFGGDV